MSDPDCWEGLTDMARTAILLYIQTGNKRASYREAFNSNSRTEGPHAQAFFKKQKVIDAIAEVQARAAARVNEKVTKAITMEEAIAAATDASLKAAVSKQKAIINAAWVLERAAILADFNIGKFIRYSDDDTKAYYDFSDANEADWYCIQEYTVDTIERGDTPAVDRVKLKSHDKLRALELVGKHVDVQAYRTQVGVGNPDGSAIKTLSDSELEAKIAQLSPGA